MFVVCLISTYPQAMREAAFFEAIGREEDTAEKEVDIDSIGRPFPFLSHNFTEVGPDYTGPHLTDGKVTLEFVLAMLEQFKNQKLIHKKYAFQIIIAAKRFFDEQPTLIDVELPPNGHISVCGDTHGQVRYDLLRLTQ